MKTEYKINDILIMWIKNELDNDYIDNIECNLEINHKILNDVFEHYKNCNQDEITNIVKNMIIHFDDYAFRILDEGVTHNLSEKELELLAIICPDCTQFDIANDIKFSDTKSYLRFLQGSKLHELHTCRYSYNPNRINEVKELKI